ncbi:MAG: hypothetical protein NTU60_11240 [Candidatus Aminicenantes bacterium]|nr:hypothetical protein [Candidatus Aminicenantes bacterium]
MTRLSEVLDELVDVRDSLYSMINDASKPDEVRRAALGEYDEVALRVRMLLARNLEKDVTNLETLAQGVKTAYGAVKSVIAQADKAADIVKGLTKFLGFVDKLIDKAKLLLPLL